MEFLPGTDLIRAGERGDNLTPHHIPSANHMEKNHGVAWNDGIAINMEQPRSGGRHRQTFTYGTTADEKMLPRDALAAGVRDARKIYMDQGLYGPYMRQQLLQLMRSNKNCFPQVFKKK